MRTEQEIRKRHDQLKKVLNPKSYCDGCGNKQECKMEIKILKWVLEEK